MKVAVLGTGQLGAMLQQAGQRIGIDVRLLDVDGAMLPDAVPELLPAELPAPDVHITVEREH